VVENAVKHNVKNGGVVISLSLKDENNSVGKLVTVVRDKGSGMQRKSFDKLSVWDDILQSRTLFIDVYKLHFGA